ncbi:MAG: hypothetical protein M3R53_00920 [Candidatus Eremiobacteraeota bacterium]|nr:hypothetical protein [Candidatus Eremiobacteraeota bacterium]
MNRDSPNPASLHCPICGSVSEAGEAAPTLRPGTTYQVVIACASCGISFVALSRN